MSPSAGWLIALIVFCVVEAATVGLVSIWFAVGALLALLVSFAAESIWVQFAVFLAVSFVCLLAVRPLARRYLPARKHATNADRVIGAEGVVTEPIDNLKAKGQIKVQGSVWTARTETGTPVPRDAMVRVLRIEGVKLIVAPLQEARKGED